MFINENEEITELVDAIMNLKKEKEYWEECYGIAINHLKEMESQYFIEHGYGFEFKK